MNEWRPAHLPRENAEAIWQQALAEVEAQVLQARLNVIVRPEAAEVAAVLAHWEARLVALKEAYQAWVSSAASPP